MLEPLLVAPPPRTRTDWVLVISVSCAVLLLAACGGGDTGSAGPPDGGGTLSQAPVTAVIPTTHPPAAVTPPPATSLDAANTCALPGFQADLLHQINAARATDRSCGVTAFAATAALAWSGPLFNAAAGHSRDMALNSYFSHTGLDGSSVGSRVTGAGYGWSNVGENIAAGQSDVSAVMKAWLASEGHCKNIMNPSYQEVALACVLQTGSTYGRYWTLVLARPR